MLPTRIVRASAAVVVAALLAGFAPASPALAASAAEPPAGGGYRSSQVPQGEYVDIDDATDAWAYSGWTTAKGQPWTWGEFGDSESFSNVAGARAILSFTGTNVELFGPRGSNGGLMRVWVDCGAPVTVDSFAPSKALWQSLARFDGLPAGSHTLTVEALGTHAGKAWDSFAMIDWARVVTDGSADVTPSDETRCEPEPEDEESDNEPLVIDDAEGSWSYSKWTSAVGESWTFGENGHSESYSNVAGARAVLSFTGTSVELFGPRGSNGGLMRVWVDCGAPVTVDSFAPSKVLQQSLARFDGLPEGKHSLIVEALGTHAGKAWDSFAMIDFARVFDDESLADPRARWMGSASEYSADAVPLRQPGCGAQSDLVSQLKLRSSQGWFQVPGSDGWGAVNGHSALVVEQGKAPGGPVVLDGEPREAATIGVPAEGSVRMSVALPDKPRSMLLWVAADATIGQPLSFAVARESGTFLPARVFRGTPGEWSSAGWSSEALLVEPGQQVAVVVDLTDDSGAGAHNEVVVWSKSHGQQAELVVLRGLVSDVSATRLATQVLDGSVALDPEHLAAPASAFRHGPVVLSRVLADAAQPAWSGNQSTPISEARAVPLSFGRLQSGEAMKVEGKPVPAGSVSVQLPEVSWPNSVSQVSLRFSTSQRCRTLSGSIGIDDSTSSRSSAWASIQVFGDDTELGLRHNGMWSSAGYPGEMADPVSNGFDRQDLADQLQTVKSAVIESSVAPDSQAAATALVNAQAQALYASGSNRSMAVTSYPLTNGLSVGATFTGDRADPDFAPSDLPRSPIGGAYQVVDAERLNPWALYPFATSLMTDRMRDYVRSAATKTIVGANQLESPLVRKVVVVISGSPGTIVDLVELGMDCVTTDPAPDGTPAPKRAMPLWSQVGVPPLFLPTPRSADGKKEFLLLGGNPAWWDAACPAGPTTTGLHYTATNTRMTTWNQLPHGVDFTDLDVVRVDEISTASLPACGLPADQKLSAFSEWELAPGSPDHPSDSDYGIGFQHSNTPTADRLTGVDGSWKDQLTVWASNTAFDTVDDPVTFALWLVLAPFDLPAAIIMNPFTQHALPMSVQAAFGLGFLEFGAEELTARLARGGEAEWLKGVPTPKENTAMLTVGQTHIEVPVTSGEYGPTADLETRITATEVVTTDHVVAGVPQSRSGGTGWIEERAGTPTVCPRMMNCPGGGAGGLADEYPGGSASHENPPPYEHEAPPGYEENPPTIPEGSETGAPEPEPGDLGQGVGNEPTGGYFARYPEWPTSSAIVEPATGLAATPRAQQAWNITKNFAAEMSGIDITEMHVGTGPLSGRLAVNTKATRAYVYLSGTRARDVLSELGGVGGLRPSAAALAELANGDKSFLDIMGATDRLVSERTVLIRASLDPDLLSSMTYGGERGYLRVVVDLPNGGGVYASATLRQAGAPAEWLAIANDAETQARADLYFAGIPERAIIRIDYMEFNAYTDTFDMAATDVRTEGMDPRILDSERTGLHSIRQSQVHEWAVFDWEDRYAGRTFDVSDPQPGFIDEAYANGAEFVVWTKHDGWVSYRAGQVGVDQETLTAAGFQRGSLNGSRSVWLPTTNDKWAVTVGGDWQPN